MRLKKGSYLYIIGMFFLYFSSFSGLFSLILGLVYRGKSAGENPLMEPFGSHFAGSLPALIMSGAFSVMAVVLASLILRYGLGSNSLSVPLRVVGISILPLSIALMALVWALFEQGETFTALAVRLWRAIPAFAFGINLIRVSLNKKNSRMLTMFFGAMSAYASFSGFGYDRLFYAMDGTFTKTFFQGWLSSFFFSLAMCLFFTGICLCVGGCERKSKVKKT